MAFSSGRDTFDENKISDLISESCLANLYLGIDKLPCTIKNPMRRDNNPSLGFYITDTDKVCYRDFATNKHGTLIEFLCEYFNINKEKLYKKIYKEITENTDIPTTRITSIYSETKSKNNPKDSTLQVKIRDWNKKDKIYWESYGVPIKWLEWANVYPISHTIFNVGNQEYVFVSDEYAYAFFEYKENNTTIKVYQPYNTKGKKWINKSDKSVLGLWTRVPPTGETICICSSLKDSLCLSANTGIPAIYVQGEGYGISKTAQKDLKMRYENVYILFDNDEAGITHSQNLSKSTGFTNLMLPKIEGAKDISDVYYVLKDKEKFKSFILSIFKKTI